MSPSRYLIGAAVIAVAIFAWWFVAGSSLVALVDRITTAPENEPTELTHFTFDEGNTALAEEPKLVFGDRQRTAGAGWRVVDGPAGHVSLETPEGSFVLGVLTRAYASNQGRRSYEFAPDSGDVVTVSRRCSRVAWPRFIKTALLGGGLPKWGRYAYDRLVWKKANGPVLDVVWRDEQRLMSGGGWSDQYDPAPPVASTLRPNR